MKTYSVCQAALLLSFASAFAQSKKPEINWPDYKFTTVVENPVTPIRDQFRSGTCWCFSANGFFEAEAIRINGITDPEKYPDFSEFFVVSNSYSERASKYVMVDGALGFSAGSQADDVLSVIRDHGIVPQSAMNGMQYGTSKPVQGEMDAVLKSYVEAVVKNPNKKLTTAWKAGFEAVLDSYLGKKPETFTVDSVEYTPASYRDALGIDPDAYISLTSFTHHPFYTYFPVEVCDNWRWNESYNVPIDELMEIIDGALQNGYTLTFGGDVSDPGFTRDGLAVFADVEAVQNAGSDKERWTGSKDEDGKKSQSSKPAKKEQKAVPEREASQEQRQTDFENKTLSDDHGMLIYGIAKDQWGGKFYIVKNSWGESGKYKGIWYMSEAFIKGSAITIMLNKAALPEEFRKAHTLR